MTDTKTLTKTGGKEATTPSIMKSDWIQDAFKTFNVPLSQSWIGFDTLFNKLLTTSNDFYKSNPFPPVNIKKIDENKYVIEMAIAGFTESEVELEMKDDILTIKGASKSDESKNGVSYIYKGIAERAFTRSFTLAENVEIKNATLLNGMLKVYLDRLAPEPKETVKKIPLNKE